MCGFAGSHPVAGLPGLTIARHHSATHHRAYRPCCAPQELDRVSSSVKPALQLLLRPHLADLDEKIRPGMQVLTWTSMNIDGYVHRFHQVKGDGGGGSAGCGPWLDY